MIFFLGSNSVVWFPQMDKLHLPSGLLQTLSWRTLDLQLGPPHELSLVVCHLVHKVVPFHILSFGFKYTFLFFLAYKIL